MSAVTLATRTFTPLAFRESTERWVVGVLATVVAVLWCFVIPLEVVLHDSGAPVASETAAPAAHS